MADAIVLFNEIGLRMPSDRPIWPCTKAARQNVEAARNAGYHDMRTRVSLTNRLITLHREIEDAVGLGVFSERQLRDVVWKGADCTDKMSRWFLYVNALLVLGMRSDPANGLRFDDHSDAPVSTSTVETSSNAALSAHDDVPAPSAAPVPRQSRHGGQKRDPQSQRRLEPSSPKVAPPRKTATQAVLDEDFSEFSTMESVDGLVQEFKREAEERRAQTARSSKRRNKKSSRGPKIAA